MELSTPERQPRSADSDPKQTVGPTAQNETLNTATGATGRKASCAVPAPRTTTNRSRRAASSISDDVDAMKRGGGSAVQADLVEYMPRSFTTKACASDGAGSSAAPSPASWDMRWSCEFSPTNSRFCLWRSGCGKPPDFGGRVGERGLGGNAAVDTAGATGSSAKVQKVVSGTHDCHGLAPLANEYGVLDHVRVMEQGFGWKRRTYDSLSKVAFAITGTRRNVLRFVGLRTAKPDGTAVVWAPSPGSVTSRHNCYPDSRQATPVRLKKPTNLPGKTLPILRITTRILRRYGKSAEGSVFCSLCDFV